MVRDSGFYSFLHHGPLSSPPFYSRSLLSISRSHQCSALPLTGRMRQISVIVTPWINQKGMLCEGLGWPALPWCVTSAMCPASTGPGRESRQSDPEPQALVWHHTSGPAKGKHFQMLFRLQQSILHNLVPARVLLGKTYLVTAEMFIDANLQFHTQGSKHTQELSNIRLHDNTWWAVHALNAVCSFSSSINSAE